MNPFRLRHVLTLIGIFMLASIGYSTAALGPGAWHRTAFPLMMYEVSVDDASSLTRYGWNILQSYGLNTTNDIQGYLQGLLQKGAAGVADIPGNGTDHPFVEWQESEVAHWIRNLAANPNLTWWSLPEEMRPGEASELQLLADYTAWTRAYDPQRRPTYEYTPNGRSAASISQIVPSVDVIGLGCYCEYIGMPHAWVRYVLQEAGLNGIAMAGKTVGNNYTAGQKTPVAVLFCAQSIGGNTNPPTMPTPAQTYHDVWSAIASGARGIAVFAYWRALHDDPSLVMNLQQLNLAASQISGPEKLGDAILYGEQYTNVTFSIILGPTQTVAFQPPSEPFPLQYPSLNILATTWLENVYVIAVNSTDQPVAAIISDLPSVTASAAVPFESRTVTVTDGSFADFFPAWGVHIYKLPAHLWLSQFTVVGGGLFQFVVSNSGVSSYTVLTPRNLMTWTPIGSATPVLPTVYQFTDPYWSNGWQGIYRVRWP